MGNKIYEQYNEKNPFLSNLELNEYLGMRKLLTVSIDKKSTGSLPTKILIDYIETAIERLNFLKYYLTETKDKSTPISKPLESKFFNE